MESINSPDLQVGDQKKYFLFGLKPIYSFAVPHDLKVVAMKAKVFLLSFFLFSVSSPLLNAQRLGRFTMSKFAAGGESGIAYPMQKSFFGKLPSDTIPSFIMDDTTFYYIYLWLSKPVKELGVQLLSPVPQYASAWKGDYEAEDYHDSLKKEGKYFNTILIVEYVGSYSPEDSKKGKLFVLDGTYDRNYNSSKASAQRSVKKNSPLRIGGNEQDTAYAPAGLYQITFTSVDNKKPEGTFVLQVGVTEVIPGLKLFRRQDELNEEHK
jgi:hypothetical protein